MAKLDEFTAFLAELELANTVVERAQSVFQAISQSTTDEALVHIEQWMACAVYVAIQDDGVVSYDGAEKKAPGVTVSHLLSKANINIMDFFNAMCSLKANHILSNCSKQSLIALERKYCIVSALYDKFENMMNDIFCVETNAQDKENELFKYYKSLCWMLFILAKAKVLWNMQELLTAFHLLLCCISEVIKNVPTFLLLPPFDSVVATNDDPLAVLNVLSETMSAKFDEVKIVYDCWLHAAGELMPNSILPELADLQSSYMQTYLLSGDIDESSFLEQDWHLMPVATESGSSPRKTTTQTVRRTLDTAKALDSILQSAPDDLSQHLKMFFKKFKRDPTNFIRGFVESFRVKFISSFEEAHGRNEKLLGLKRYEMATRYYFLMLDSVVRKEAERLSVADLENFLHNETFHRSLLACCTEVIIMSCGSVGSVNFTPVQHGCNFKSQGIVFPWILSVFNLKAYNFFKVIESFIKTAPTITHQIIKHLQTIEDSILQSLAWTGDSPIWDQLHPSHSSRDNKCKGKPMCSCSMCNSARTFKSPEKCSLLSPAVNNFLNKVGRLAGTRLNRLASFLNLREDVVKCIWTCIEHVIYKNSLLLKNHHLDQIIMCCIYAICKINNLDVRFKTIISLYSQMPNAKESVYKQVLVGGKEEYIVKFYNEEFATGEMENFITQNFPEKNEDSGSLKAKPSPLSPTYSVPGRKNIYVSRLGQSPFKDPNELIFQTVLPSYSFGSLDQSSKNLQVINDAVKIFRSGSKNHDAKGKRRSSSDGSCSDQNDIGTSTLGSARKHLKFD